jgi:hypothetical protein
VNQAWAQTLKWNHRSGQPLRRDWAWVRHRLVGAWLCNEGVGTLLREASGYGGQGNFTGSVGWTRSPWGWALDFPGSPARVTVPRLANPRFGRTWSHFTVMVMVRPTANPTQARLVHLGAENPAETSTGPWSFYLDWSTVTNGIVLRRVNTVPTETDAKIANVTTLNVWQLLGMTVRRRTDTSGWTMAGYRDGMPKGLTHKSSNSGATYPMSTDPTLGADTIGGLGLVGQLAGVWIWDYGMSPGQVARFAADPFAAWRFDPTSLMKPGAGAGASPQGGGVPAILRRRHGGL